MKTKLKLNRATASQMLLFASWLVRFHKGAGFLQENAISLFNFESFFFFTQSARLMCEHLIFPHLSSHIFQDIRHGKFQNRFFRNPFVNNAQ